MTNEDKLEKVNETLQENDCVFAKGVHDVNHRPHPYMIGPKHVSYASEHFGGILDERTVNKIKCDHPGCNLLYDEHVSDCFLFFQLKRDVLESELHIFIDPLVPILKDLKIDGIAFVETDEKFRVKADEKLDNTSLPGDSN